MPEGDPYDFGIQPSEYLTEVQWLSEYHEPLANTPADTPVYIFEGDEPGGTLFVLGGTHVSEPAGIMAAILMVEQLAVSQGRVVVVPYGNALAVHPDRNTMKFETEGGERSFYGGSRRSLTRHYEDDDPETFESPSGANHSGAERRNLNRVFPGVVDGTSTKQIGYAIIRLIEAQDSNVAFDLHETTQFPGNLAWTLAGRSELEPIIDDAVDQVNSRIELDLMLPRISDDRPGLSRTEWGPATGVRAFLTETVRGGKNKTPLATRVAIQIECVRAVVDAYNEQAEEDQHIQFEGLPEYKQLVEHGLGAFLQPDN